jgi:transcriptional regulator CtsR
MQIRTKNDEVGEKRGGGGVIKIVSTELIFLITNYISGTQKPG